MLDPPIMPEVFGAETADAIASALAGAVRPSDQVALQCGHFLLAYHPGHRVLVPCLSDFAEGSSKNNLLAQAGGFPEHSFALGMALIRSIQAQEKRILVVAVTAG